MPLPLNCPSCGETNFLASESSEFASCHNCGAPLSVPSGVEENPQIATAEREAHRPLEFPSHPPASEDERDNPYGTPVFTASEARSTGEHRRPQITLANRSTRLAAACVDTFVELVTLIASMLIADGLKISKSDMYEVIAFAILAVASLQILIIGGMGQSIGKIVFRIRIVNDWNDEVPGALRIILVRELIRSIPLLGWVGYLCIFNQDRRCLHDIVARTRVIEVR